MKKEWTNAEIVELNVTATANMPTDETAIDGTIVGSDGKNYGTFGKLEGSGTVEDIHYYH